MNHYLNSILGLVLSFYLIGCANVPKVITNTTSYGKSNLQKVIYFLPKSNLEENTLVEQCKVGANRAGMKILLDPCPECLSVDLNAKVTGTKTVNAGTVSTYYGYGVATHQNRIYDVTSRQAELKIYQNDKQVHGIKINSEGYSKELLPVIKYMCQAAFMNYPNISSETIGVKLDVKE